MFSILYENMNAIDPTGDSFENAWSSWRDVIGRALDDPRRTLLVIYDGEEIAGFFMYATNRENGLFLMEEIQFRSRYQRIGLFHRLYDEVLLRLPIEVTIVEAYAHKKNLRSQGILAHFGLSVVGENCNGSCLRYRGDFSEFAHRMKTKK